MFRLRGGVATSRVPRSRGGRAVLAMHEMSLVRDVVDIVNQRAAECGNVSVRAVHLTIGDGRDIVFDLVDGLFKYLARGTACAGAELVVRHVPLTVRCRRCGTVFPIDVFDSATWTCPRCTAEHDYDLNSGMEFSIDRIEVIDAPAVDGAPTGGEAVACADRVA